MAGILANEDDLHKHSGNVFSLLNGPHSFKQLEISTARNQTEKRRFSHVSSVLFFHSIVLTF